MSVIPRARRPAVDIGFVEVVHDGNDPCGVAQLSS